MVLVEVLDLPIRYNGVRYEKGSSFKIDPNHFIPSTMKMVGEVSNDQTDHLSSGIEPVVLKRKELESMSEEGLKDYAKEFGIDLGRTSTKEGIVNKIVKAQNKEVK